MRGIAAVLIGFPLMLAGIVLAVVAGIWAGITTESFLKGFALFTVMTVGVVWICAKIMNATLEGSRRDMTGWLNSKSDCQFRAAYDGDGIALDPRKSLIYLTRLVGGQQIEKSYTFADVREWGVQMPGTSPVVAYGTSAALATQAAMYNAASATKAADETGFWVKVRDVDHPRWLIRFRAMNVHEREVRAELDRWMEIFAQYVKDDRPAAESASPVHVAQH